MAVYAMYIVFRAYEAGCARVVQSEVAYTTAQGQGWASTSCPLDARRGRGGQPAARSGAGRVTVTAPSNDRRHGMGNVGKLLKSAVVAKAAQVAIREMSKPENQRRAKELLGRVTKRGGSTGRA